jgi:hypothetical protein
MFCAEIFNDEKNNISKKEKVIFIKLNFFIIMLKYKILKQ